MYYLRINGTVKGPASREKIQSLWDAGKIPAGTRISEDRTSWQKIEEFMGGAEDADELEDLEEEEEEAPRPRKRKSLKKKKVRRGEEDGPDYDEFVAKKTSAGVCAMLLGSLGIHKFILGLSNAGIIMLVVTLVTCGIGGIVMGLIAFIEGIIYLTKKDDEFYEDYGVNKKGWF